MMTGRATLILAVLLSGATHRVAAQRLTPRRNDATSHEDALQHVQRDTWRRSVPHYGKWLTAAGAAALTVLGAEQHRLSRQNWNALLLICRSADDACAVGTDGRYLRSDAELLYQRSRIYDRRANRWLLGAQATLLATTALFIIDLHPGEGPDNIPYPAQLRVGAVGDGAGIAIGYRLPAIR